MHSEVSLLISWWMICKLLHEFLSGLRYEPPHDKTNKMAVRPAKTQISLGIRLFWSESSLSAWRKIGSLATHWAHSEDSDQTGRMSRLVWVFAGCTCHFVGFVMRRLICFIYTIEVLNASAMLNRTDGNVVITKALRECFGTPCIRVWYSLLQYSRMFSSFLFRFISITLYHHSLFLREFIIFVLSSEPK